MVYQFFLRRHYPVQVRGYDLSQPNDWHPLAHIL